MKKRYPVPCLVIALLVTMFTACALLDGGNLAGPAGGFVFYDKGSYSGGWRYMECALKNAGTGTWEESKQMCDEYKYGGYDDWELPEKDALKKLLDGKHGSRSFNNGVYWSSSEDGSSAWGIQNGDDATPSGNSYSSGKVKDPSAYSKSGEYWARPVRRF